MTSEQSFMRVLREQVIAQANMLEALTAHPTLVGAGRERAVIDMLRGQIPRRYEVLTGTVLGQDDDGSWQREDRQLDVMVVDTFDYPTILRNGDIAVVLPQAVRVVIEVKSDLCAPPDPDRADPSEEPSSTGDDDGGLFSEDPPAAKKSKKPNSKETFLDAIKQVSRNRLLFGEKPVLTVLLSHKYPAGNETLRRWIELVLKTRWKLRERLGSLQEGSQNYSSVERELHLLEASSLPDVIIAGKGAIATRDGSRFNFFVAGHTNDSDKRDAAPGMVTLVSYVVSHLHRIDPVVQMMQVDPRYKPLTVLRQGAHDLFLKVMDPGLKPDDTNNPPLELTEHPPAPDKKRSSHWLNDDDDWLPQEEPPEFPEPSPEGGV